MIHWLALAASPSENLVLPERQRKLLEGIAELIAAPAWIWLAGVSSGGQAAPPVIVTIQDGGWSDDEERNQLLRAVGHSQDLMRGVFGAGATWPKHPFTCSSESFPSPIGSPSNADCRMPVETGFEHVLVSVFTLGLQAYSGIVLYRRCGEPPFLDRERAIVHAMFQHVDWIHRSVFQAAALVGATDISPREREVLMRLLAGESRKTIAANLRLSVYTVADHLKQIYRKLGVKTRAGLMAKFIQCSVSPPSSDGPI
ncbi:MAG TPA: helix-turn-helix transcriptional regulator [Lacipirellula sp.]